MSRITRFVICAAGFCLVASVLSGCDGETPSGPDAARGQTIFTTVQPGEVQACADCHCTAATGWCGYEAPNIQGKTFADIDAQVREVSANHTGGQFGLSDQDVEDIAAFLATFTQVSKILNLGVPESN